MKTLSHGVPVVVMPFGRDQKDNGARVEVAGTACRSPATGTHRGAIRRLLEEPLPARTADSRIIEGDERRSRRR
jgi:UDP:flavonoid glycosyltransferase YjiC (YdhE family)